MIRRLVDGLLIALVAWFALSRLDAGGIAVGLVLAAVFLFTGWRIAALWRKYRRLVHELAAAEAAKLSDDPAARARAERIMARRQMAYVADMTIWTGFVLGGAAIDMSRSMAHGGIGKMGGGMGMGGGMDGGGGM
jgi:uncharacterized membrane protein YgcG